MKLARHLPLICLVSLPAWAQVTVSDNLTGTASNYRWTALGRACLTAGNGSGPIPACGAGTGGATGRIPDAVGSGALRLTDTNMNRSGAVISANPYPSNKGLQIIFKTVTYGGTGADGMSFFLSDGSLPPSLGAMGGGLGYACSNDPAYGEGGVVGGYLGIGIDEYGNFSYPPMNTATGPGFTPGNIVLRGRGSVAWSALSAAYPAQYPASTDATSRKQWVADTCRTGKVRNTTQSLPDYDYIGSSKLPGGVSIGSSSGSRNGATPITYSLDITPDGLLSFSYSVNGGANQTVMNRQSITAVNGPMPATFRFGFAGSTGGRTNNHEIMCFKAAPFNQSSGSAASNTQQASRVQTGSKVYSAYYQSGVWSGSVLSQGLLYDAATDTVSIAAQADWDGSCVLSGGACTATGGSNTVQAPSQRALLTWNGSTGTALQWDSLTVAQKAALGASTRLDYLRGDRSLEIDSLGSGSYRARSSVLGDVIGSSPVWVGPPSLPYGGPWKDRVTGADGIEGSSYGSFASDNATRLNVVYTGANDGLLHGFRAGSLNAAKTFVDSSDKPNDGRELIGYMPGLVLDTIRSATTAALDFSDTTYGHNYYVDATPGSGDLYYQGAWHTWLVGGLGAGGNADGAVADATATTAGAIYALDITAPGSFGENLANSVVIGEWTSATLSCTGNAACGASLGSTYGTPIIRRLHDGNWAVIFGNGLNSSSGKAGVFVMTVDRSSGSRSVRFLDTGAGATAAGKKNGIVNVAAVDLDGDHVSDYLYAGDVLGNLWRFDVTSGDASRWAAGASALFSTGGKPITASVLATPAPASTGDPRLLISFGTGQAMPQTRTSAVAYASGTHSIYGVWDTDMAAWNALGSSRYASREVALPIAAASLQSQTVTTVAAGGNSPAYRTLSSNKVCWLGGTACSGDANTRLGWKLDLPASGEQIIYNPGLKLGLFAVNTTIPPGSQVLSCDTVPPSGFTMAISPYTGGASQQTFFPNAGSNTFSSTGTVINGLSLNATGAPYLVTAGSNNAPYFVQQTTGGKVVPQRVNRFANAVGSRATWIELR